MKIFYVLQITSNGLRYAWGRQCTASGTGTSDADLILSAGAQRRLCWHWYTLALAALRRPAHCGTASAVRLTLLTILSTGSGILAVTVDGEPVSYRSATQRGSARRNHNPDSTCYCDEQRVEQ